MSRPWQRNEETTILVFNLPSNQPRLGLYSPIYLILITLDKMPSLFYCWNSLHNAQVARRGLHWAGPFHNEGSTLNWVIIKFTHHINTHYHHPVTPLKSLREREEYEEIQNKENKLAHTYQPAECRDARASTPEERRPEGGIPCMRAYGSVDKGWGLPTSSSIFQTWLQGCLKWHTWVALSTNSSSVNGDKLNHFWEDALFLALWPGRSGE